MGIIAIYPRTAYHDANTNSLRVSISFERLLRRGDRSTWMCRVEGPIPLVHGIFQGSTKVFYRHLRHICDKAQGFSLKARTIPLIKSSSDTCDMNGKNLANCDLESPLPMIMLIFQCFFIHRHQL